MFRKTFLAATVTAGFFLFGCNNSSSLQSITVKIDGMSSIADAACLYMDVRGNQANSYLVMTEVKNDQFTLELPETIDPSYLRPVNHEIGGGEGVAISDASAKCCEATIEALKNNNIADRFYYECDNDAILAETYIYYSDKDVNITGTDNNGVKYSCNLKRGWNYVADIIHRHC